MVKNKNGFTLVEVLATIVILSILLTITIGTIVNSISGTKSNISDSEKEMLLSTAKLYFENNVDLADADQEEYYVCIQKDLVDNGYFEKEYDVTGKIKIVITKTDGVITKIKSTDFLDVEETNCLSTSSIEDDDSTEGDDDNDGSDDSGGDDDSGDTSNPCRTGKEFTLLCKILGANKNNVIGSSSSLTDSDRGLYEHIESVNSPPIYFFRGSASHSTIKPTYKMNNYVKTENNIWRVMWVSDNGIQLISQNNINGTNSVYEDDIESTLYNYAYNVEMEFGKNLNTENFFCKANKTVSLENASFGCPSGSSYMQEIGTVTADEMLFAGATTTTKYDNITYLDNGTTFWTMTGKNPSYRWFRNHGLGNNVLGKFFYGDITYGSVPESASLRAVVYLKPDTEVMRGDGLSESTAYEIAK